MVEPSEDLPPDLLDALLHRRPPRVHWQDNGHNGDEGCLSVRLLFGRLL